MLGSSLKKVFPVPDDASFDALLKALDELDRKAGRDGVRGTRGRAGVSVERESLRLIAGLDGHSSSRVPVRSCPGRRIACANLARTCGRVTGRLPGLSPGGGTSLHAGALGTL